ncbi:MAG: hypothetical protein Q7V05_06475 [Methanoregula sp.]|nr:hypothetical protein [Methanoregula sp.]
MLVVVSDSSPLMNLAGIDRLYLVHEQFGEVIIPPSVWDEIVLNSDTLPGVSEVRKAYDAGWISIARPDNT